MDKLTCKTCGSDSVTPMNVVLRGEEQEQALLGEEQESHFYTCQVCGDNWLSVKETDLGGTCQITFIHQMGMDPTLRRVAHMATPVVVNEDTIDHWDYFVDEDPVAEEEWFDTLEDRRDVLRSVCMN